MDGRPVTFKRPQDAREAGIETVYQTLAVAPALDIASNLYLAREERRPGLLGSVFRMLDKKGMRERASKRRCATSASPPCRTCRSPSSPSPAVSGRPSRSPAPRPSAARWSSSTSPTAALGVRESAQVLRLVESLRDRGLGVILISHNMPHVWEVADRIHVQRLGGCAGVITQSHTR